MHVHDVDESKSIEELESIQRMAQNRHLYAQQMPITLSQVPAKEADSKS